MGYVLGMYEGAGETINVERWAHGYVWDMYWVCMGYSEASHVPHALNAVVGRKSERRGGDRERGSRAPNDTGCLPHAYRMPHALWGTRRTQGNNAEVSRKTALA